MNAHHLHPTTQEQQAALTSDQVLQQLREGNARHVEDQLSARSLVSKFPILAQGQYPKAAFLSCIDSRVIVEQIFDQGPGDLFVGRVAGNVVSEDQLASLEYATKYAGAKLIVVMGHEGCGAVKGACAHLEDSHLTSLLAKIKPAISAAQEKGISSEAPEFVNVVIEQNIYEQVKQLREQSPILASLEKEGKISIVGAYYAISTGEVTFMNEDQ